MRIVSLLGLILYVCGRDSDSTLSLFGSLVDHVECNSLAGAKSCIQGLGDSSGQSGFTMVNVANGTNVTMGLSSFKFSFCHY